MEKNKAFSESNRQKALAGSELTKYIEKELEELTDKGLIKGFQKDKSFNHKDFQYKKQFLANFLIETYNNKFIIVRSSNSFRSDRAKIGFYDLNGIIQFSDFSKNVIASIYLVPDTELESAEFNRIREKINQNIFYCPATHILTLSEFFSFLKEHEYEIISEFGISTHEVLKLDTLHEKGSFYGKRGNNFERELVAMLSNYKNLIDFKKKKLRGKKAYKLIISKLLVDYSIDIKSVVKISATNSIPLLKSGGNSKTDIKIEIETAVTDTIIETISLKNTSKSRVSCHDYAAKDFIRVLKCKGEPLADYFNLFQQYPTYKEFEKKLLKGSSINQFVSLLNEKEETFNQWVLTGKHDLQNLISPEIQISNYLLLRNSKNEKIAFYEMLDYIRHIKENSKGKFGVPFSWTYPSKQRGKRIQLKVPVLFI